MWRVATVATLHCDDTNLSLRSIGVKHYDVIVNGFPTTLLLSDADAAARGLSAVTEKADAAPADKAAAPPNKSRTPRNKAP